MALAQFKKGRPLVADFASKQIDDTALFSFADATRPLVFYAGGVHLNVGFNPFYPASANAIFADEDWADDIDYFFYNLLVVTDLGHYRVELQSQDLSGLPQAFYIQSSALAADALQLSVLDIPPTPATATFQVLFRFYAQGTQIGALKEGEVALFQQCNYQGKAVVFASDTPNFAELTSKVITLDNTAASVRLGNNTSAVLHSGPVYTGTRTVVKVDTPCLPRPTNATSLLVRPLDRTLTIGPGGCVNCRLVGANLVGVDLSALDLRGADLTRANVSCATFAGTDNDHRMDLTTTQFDGAIFGSDPSCRTKFNWTILNADSIPPAQWRFVNLSNANIFGLEGKVLSSQSSPLDLTNAVLNGASLQDAILDFATGLARANLTQIKLTHASLRHVDLSTAQLPGAVLDNAILDGATFTGANLSQAKLNGASLQCLSPTGGGTAQCVDLTGAQLQGALLNNANLTGASLYNAFLSNNTNGKITDAASLHQAHIKNVNLAFAQLSGVDFHLANFYGDVPANNANGCATTGSNHTGFTVGCASAHGANMSETRFGGAYLYGVDFTNASIAGVDFSDAVLVGANFAGALISPSADSGAVTDFLRAFLQGTNLDQAITLSHADLTDAFVDFRSGGNIISINLNGANHNSFACSTPSTCVPPSGQDVCVWVRYPTTTVPAGNTTMTCPDTSGGGCGAADPSGGNPHWNSRLTIGMPPPGPPPGWYSYAATYTPKAPDGVICGGKGPEAQVIDW